MNALYTVFNVRFPDTYQRGIEKLKLAEAMSDIESEPEKKRRRIISSASKKAYYFYNSSDEEESTENTRTLALPSLPQLVRDKLQSQFLDEDEGMHLMYFKTYT